MAFLRAGQVEDGSLNYNIGKAYRSIALARYNTDGSLDGTFSGDGMATFDLPTPCNGDEYGLDLIIRPDGRMVVTGW
ncbi:MAG: hypothetical protein IPO17_15940 [Flavobacteriales bacterium]|nr:hypothetical protein [Flavobacteriales bacterium]